MLPKTNEITRSDRGFTLLEMMVVLVIIAVLAGFAYPSYVDAVRRTKRAEAQTALMHLMQQQERYYTLHNMYVEFSSAKPSAGSGFRWYSGESAKDSAYEIRATACEGQTLRQCVMLTAIPGTEKVQVAFRDPACGELSLDSNGKKTASGNATGCWF